MSKTIKEQLFALCENSLKEQVQSLEAAIRETKESVASETKSSAGDKHETARAMAQLEEEKLSQQYNEALKQLQSLSKLASIKATGKVLAGSLIITDNGRFYIAAGLGKLLLNGDLYYAISPVSPMAKAVIGLKTGDTFNINNNRYTINALF